MEPEMFSRIVEIRRDLHRHPELSWEEKRTSERVREVLTGLGLEPRTAADTGVVVDLPGPADLPAIALRADLDALPIHEETGLPFDSVHEGIMHACGHDGHTSMLLGAAELLSQETTLPAPVRLIFQPAEERGSGAKAMIEAGVLEGVEMIYGGHLDRHYTTGTLVVTAGVVNACTDSFRIEITGPGGHAARPHEAVDAVVAGSLMVMAIQTIVSREIDPAHPSVVSVGRFDAGTAANVIAGRARLEGTIRAQDPDVRANLKAAVSRIAESTARLHGAEIDIELFETWEQKTSATTSSGCRAAISVSEPGFPEARVSRPTPAGSISTRRLWASVPAGSPRSRRRRDRRWPSERILPARRGDPRRKHGFRPRRTGTFPPSWTSLQLAIADACD
jgi:hippurate hydrolase